jgi:hypothetical protein
MSRQIKADALKEFMKIPGVGPKTAEDLWELDYSAVSELENEDPERMYLLHCLKKGTQVDRCVLYVFRCAVYYASNTVHDPELLKWWNWKNP